MISVFWDMTLRLWVSDPDVSKDTHCCLSQRSSYKNSASGRRPFR